ncbi:MAG: sulfurtransferase [Burkholderiales bacterium]|jgi:rhodanese-related sulfurtransferase|nr:sulfurtransferase [Burkholderiales bacterium]
MKQLAVQQLDTHCSTSQALLLDVREPWEVELASISLPGVAAKHIPMGSIPDRLDDLEPSQSIVCICHHGVRSLQVVAFLERHGFESVYNLAGGIDAWSVEVDPTVPRY